MSPKRVIIPDSLPIDYSRYTFSPAVEKKGWLWVSGTIAEKYDPNLGKVVCLGDTVAEQMRIAYQSIAMVLEAAGYSFGDVVKTVDYLAPGGLEGYPETTQVRREFFGDTFPAATGIVVQRLLRPDALVEVEVVAHKDGERRELNPDPKAFNRLTFLPGVERGGVLWLSGHTARQYSPSGEVYYEGDVVQQARLIYDKMRRLLTAAGLTSRDVVKVLTYIAPEGGTRYGEVAPVRHEFAGQEFPASTGVIVQHLLRPEALLEVEMVAVRGTSERRVITPAGWSRYESLPFRPGVKKGEILFLAGQVGLDPRTERLAGDDVVTQTRQALQNIQVVLEEAGATLDDIVRTVDYILPEALPQYRETTAIRRELLGPNFPAATGVVIPKLLRPGALIEITAVAIPD